MLLFTNSKLFLIYFFNTLLSGLWLSHKNTVHLASLGMYQVSAPYLFNLAVFLVVLSSFFCLFVFCFLFKVKDLPWTESLHQCVRRQVGGQRKEEYWDLDNCSSGWSITDLPTQPCIKNQEDYALCTSAKVDPGTRDQSPLSSIHRSNGDSKHL